MNTKPRYLRLGGITKYALNVLKKELQPANVAKDYFKNTPRKPLPPPPSNSIPESSPSTTTATPKSLKPPSTNATGSTKKTKQDRENRSSRKRDRSKKNLLLQESKPKSNDRQKLKKQRQKSVTFDTVQVREFTHILGDNPAVASGAPVTLDWTPKNESRLNIDLYEQYSKRQQGRRASRSRRSDLTLPVQQRARILMRAGYSMNEIVNAAVEATRIRKERAETLERQGWERLDLFRESALRALRRRVVLHAKPAFSDYCTRRIRNRNFELEYPEPIISGMHHHSVAD